MALPLSFRHRPLPYRLAKGAKGSSPLLALCSLTYLVRRKAIRKHGAGSAELGANLVRHQRSEVSQPLGDRRNGKPLKIWIFDFGFRIFLVSVARCTTTRRSELFIENSEMGFHQHLLGESFFNAALVTVNALDLLP